jgi:fumarate reductase flavoprotein subunit
MDGPDLVVAGAGGGLVAALRANQLGLSVVVVEASASFRRGNNTSMSTAMVPGAGSRFQLAAGLDDSADRFVSDVMHKSHDEADQTVTRALADVSARLVEWMADDLGLPMQLVTDFDYPGHSVRRCHTVPGRSGATMLGMLADAVAAAGIDVIAPARLESVSRSGDGMTVELVYPDGSRESIECGAVLLATNGFGASAELVQQYIPEIAGAVYHGSDQSLGDALRIGAQFEAGTGYLDAYQGHGALTVGANTLVGWGTVLHGGIIINRNGERFADETQGYSEFASIELTQPDHWAAIVFDQPVYDAQLLFDDFKQTVEMGAVRRAESIAELAELLDVPLEALEVTMAECIEYAAGATDPFARTQWRADPLHAPYYVSRVQPALFHTQGGLLVDADARVLDSAGSPIDGLYAAGGAAVGISGHGAAGYLAGNGLLSALGLSFLAAEHVAAQTVQV